jgi:uncharacterized protein YbjT (DUF2867 family)
VTRYQAEQAAISLRAAGWPVVYIEIDDDGTWQAVAEDPGTPAEFAAAIDEQKARAAAVGQLLGIKAAQP